MVMTQLHPGAKWLFRIRGFFGSLFLIVFFSIFISSILLPSLDPENISRVMGIVFLIGIIILLILAEVYARLAYHFWNYEFTGDQLRIERGIIWKRYSNIPYERIQNVDITRGIIARLCGFSTINLQTAGYSMPVNNRGGAGAEGYIPAVPMNEAEKIREFVIRKIGKRKGQGL